SPAAGTPAARAAGRRAARSRGPATPAPGAPPPPPAPPTGPSASGRPPLLSAVCGPRRRPRSCPSGRRPPGAARRRAPSGGAASTRPGRPPASGPPAGPASAPPRGGRQVRVFLRVGLAALQVVGGPAECLAQHVGPGDGVVQLRHHPQPGADAQVLEQRV